MRLARPKPSAYLEKVINEILNTDGSAQVVAFSFALGTLIALLPTFGFGVFIGLLLIIVFPSLHKPGLLIAFVVWNPFLQLPLYSLSLAIGSVLYSGLPVVSFDIAVLDQVYNLTRRLIVGNLIVSSTASVLSYIFLFVLIRKLKGRSVFSF